jgi:hypothetical protein
VGNEENKQEVEQQEQKIEAPSLVTATRVKFDEQFAQAHEKTDSQESESEAAPVTEQQSDSSSVKEEVKGGAKPEEKAVDKTDELLKNKEKALHEEREKRKQANLKLREIERQYAEKFKALEEKLNAVVTPKDESVKDTESDPKVSALQKRLQEIEERNQQEEIASKQKKLQEEITKTDKNLKEEGFPGFRYAVNRVDEELKRMFAEGEIDESDYLDPTQWKEVYKTKIYDELASEFKAIQKQETIENRLNNKKAAAKVSSNAGAKPETKKVDEEAEPDTDDVKEYLSFRKNRAAKNS